MIQQRIDISVLRPFTDEQIVRYTAFLRQHGQTELAAAVEAEARPSLSPPEGNAPPAD